jgi:hypothetical protein
VLLFLGKPQEGRLSLLITDPYSLAETFRTTQKEDLLSVIPSFL